MSADSLGFGTAGLFHPALSGPRERLAMLEAAFANGIRHYDLAPIYGLGKAEPEFARFARRHRAEITIATKFGLEPTLLGRSAGLVQSPIRRLLNRSRGATAAVKQSGRSADSGLLGRLLYRTPVLTADVVRRSAERSRARLGVERIDYFLLHESTDPVSALTPEVVDALEQLRADGTIGTWGTAGDVVPALREGSPLTRIGAVQTRYDLLTDPVQLPPGVRQLRYAALSRALPLAVQSHAAGGLSRRELAAALLRDAVRDDATLLFTSTSAASVERTVAAVDVVPDTAERTFVDALRCELKGSA